MRTNKLLAGALVCLLGLTAVTSCGKEEPKAPAPTQQTADRLINRVHVDSSVYMQAVQDFVLPTSVQDGDAVYPIKWTSDNEVNAAIIDVKKTDKDGKEYVEKTVKIVRPAYDKNAESQGVAYTLTAELTTGEFKQTKKFSGYVMMMENILKLENVSAIYDDYFSESHDKERPYVVKAYIAQAVKDGFFIRSSEQDKAIYVYGKTFLEDTGHKVGDHIEIQGEVSSYNGGLQFKADKSIIKDVKKSEPKELGMPTPAEAVDLAKFIEMDEAAIKAIAYNKITLTGKIIEVKGKYTDYYIETPEGKAKVKIDYGASVKDAYNKVKAAVGTEITIDVIVHGTYKNKHTVDVINVH